MQVDEKRGDGPDSIVNDDAFRDLRESRSNVPVGEQYGLDIFKVLLVDEPIGMAQAHWRRHIARGQDICGLNELAQRQ